MKEQARMPGSPGEGRGRPTRTEIEPAALVLVQRYGPQIMGVARRYSSTPEDAEDAYQRALEILLTKAPTTNEAELLPWVKTVVKHEAFALGRHRGRVTLGGEDSIDGDSDRDATPPPTPAEQAERLEQLAVGAEALNGLKPQEIRALRLLAEGHSYQEIQEVTGWTYTKVNRCLTEGRRRFVERVTGIERGLECERLAPELSALADGEAGPEELARLRPHMRTCLSCRVTLREFRATPARVAALLPPVALVGTEAPEGAGPLVDELGAAVGEHTGGMSPRELAGAASTGRVAVVLAALALAGGGVAAGRTLAPAQVDTPGAAVVVPAPDTPAPARAGGDEPPRTPPAPSDRRRGPRDVRAPRTAREPARARPRPPRQRSEQRRRSLAVAARPSPAPAAGTGSASGGGAGSTPTAAQATPTTSSGRSATPGSPASGSGSGSSPAPSGSSPPTSSPAPRTGGSAPSAPSGSGGGSSGGEFGP